MTAAKDLKSNQLSFKSASLDQLWACLQRCLLFEEPSSRWTKLLAQTARLVNGKSRDLSQLPFSEQQNCFRKVFGTPEDLLEPTARLFNLILALQDLRNFESADFDIWFFSQGNDELPLTSAPEFTEIAKALLKAEPTAAQSASLAHAWNTVPYWRVLESNGPWAEDSLTEFAVSVLGKLDRMRPVLEPDSVMSAEHEFRMRLCDWRSKLPGNFQPSVLVLVEGSTESILLPRFLSLTDRKSKDGTAMFIACGGANQLLRKYLHLQDLTHLPILCVVDHDAAEQIETIEDVLREKDHLHIWSVGEIEDTFPAGMLLESLNAYLQSLGVAEYLSMEDLGGVGKRTESLDRMWRHRGLGDFDKVGFAEFQAGRVRHSNEIPKEAQMLMNTIREMAAGKHGG